MGKRKVNRRDFLKGAAIAGVGLAAGGGLLYGRRALAALIAGGQEAVDQAIRDHKLGQIGDEDAQATVAAYMTEGGGAGEPRVVHVHDPDAASWDFSTGWYGHYVDQSVVSNMVDEGLKQLTAQSNVAVAWQALLPGYVPGKAIAIKVNFNNSHEGCADSDNIIDALIEPVNALVRGMKELDVQEEDIWIYDASRCLPDRFRTRCPYPNVRFFDKQGRCAEPATFSSSDPNAEVHFRDPSLTARRVADVAINAAYLVNMPIVKDHAGAGVTLSFKNHFGSIDEIVRSGDDNLHDHMVGALVDVNLNPHIRDKTVLIVGDGLYGALGNTGVVPLPWSSFGDEAPNSLFFAIDPVAVDCVMFDILDADPGHRPRYGWNDDYLEIAASEGLGVFERGDPWGGGYNQIDYVRIEL